MMNAKKPWPSIVTLPTNFRRELLDVLMKKNLSLMTVRFREACGKNFRCLLLVHFVNITSAPKPFLPDVVYYICHVMPMPMQI